MTAPHERESEHNNSKICKEQNTTLQNEERDSSSISFIDFTFEAVNARLRNEQLICWGVADLGVSSLGNLAIFSKIVYALHVIVTIIFCVEVHLVLKSLLFSRQSISKQPKKSYKLHPSLNKLRSII